VRVRSASANSPAFARYGPRTGPRLAHSLDCEGICCAIAALPAVALRFGGHFSLFRGQSRRSARKNVLVDLKSRFFCRKTDFPRREVHFLASRAVFFRKSAFFSEKGGGCAQKTAFPTKKGVLLAGKHVSGRGKAFPRQNGRFFEGNSDSSWEKADFRGESDAPDAGRSDFHDGRA